MSILQRVCSWFGRTPRPSSRGMAWVQLDYDVPTDEYVLHFQNAARRFIRSEFVDPTVMPTVHVEPIPGHWGDLQQRKEHFLDLLTATLPDNPVFGVQRPEEREERACIQRAIEAQSIAFFDARRRDGRRFIGILTWKWKT